MSASYLPSRKKLNSLNLWYERFMAVFLVVNILLVIFDLSYISNRSLYFFYVRYQDRPFLTDLYDPIKGIKPHRQTQNYLHSVDLLTQQLKLTGKKALDSPETEQLLQQIRNQSDNLINTDPFASANLSGYLEKIKDRMREHIGNESAKLSFQTFWSQPYLKNHDLNAEINFYRQEIQPSLAVNYFRHIDETGFLVDRFWQIDIWFNLLFGFEFIVRTSTIARRYKIKWFNAMLWRWYDIFLILPFWRILRTITVIIRLNQARLIELYTIKKQASKGFVNTIADELTEVVVIHVIDRAQDSIRRGEISDFLSHTALKPYIDINNTNETAEIAKLLSRVFVRQILPQIRPEVENLLQYSIQKVLKQTPGYQGMQFLPGIGNLQTNLTEQIVKRIYQYLSEVLESALEDDPVFEEHLENLVATFNKSIASEIQNRQSLVKIESLLVELLQEIKINYVEPISEKDVDTVWQETKIVPRIKGNKNEG
jgi:hypothetical protein